MMNAPKNLLPWERPLHWPELPNGAELYWYALKNADIVLKGCVSGSMSAALLLVTLVSQVYHAAGCPNGVKIDEMDAWWKERLQALEN